MQKLSEIPARRETVLSIFEKANKAIAVARDEIWHHKHFSTRAGGHIVLSLPPKHAHFGSLINILVTEKDHHAPPTSIYQIFDLDVEGAKDFGYFEGEEGIVLKKQSSVVTTEADIHSEEGREAFAVAHNQALPKQDLGLVSVSEEEAERLESLLAQ